MITFVASLDIVDGSLVLHYIPLSLERMGQIFVLIKDQVSVVHVVSKDSGVGFSQMDDLSLISSGLLFNWDVLYFVINSFFGLGNHHIIFLLHRNVVDDVLNLVVVSESSLDRHPLLLLHIVNVFLLVRNVFHSALRRRRVRSIHILLNLLKV